MDLTLKREKKWKRSALKGKFASTTTPGNALAVEGDKRGSWGGGCTTLSGFEEPQQPCRGGLVGGGG